MRIKMPAVRIAPGDSDAGTLHQDMLTCGVCQKPFALGDINKFIQHKVHACNKENYALEQNNVPDPSDNDDAGCGGVPLAVVNTRRPSISAPIKKGISGGGRLICSSPLQMDDEARCSTPKRPRTPNSSASPTPIKDEMDVDHHHHHHPHHPLDNCTDDYELKPRKIKQELDSTNSSPDLLKKSRDVADAESNTSHSEPSYYICSTCKLKLHSAWRLVQHAQNVHGIKIYVESSSSPSSSSSSSLSPSANAASSLAAAASASKSANASSTNNHSSSSSCSASSALSGCSAVSSTGGAGCQPSTGSSLAGSSLPLPASAAAAAAAAAISRLPLLPPGSAADAAAVAAHNRFAVSGLLGMQLNEPPPGLRHHPFPSPLSLHSSAGPPPPPSSMFPRPSSASSSHHENHFRMEQIVSEQFRLNQQHSLNLAAAAAAVAAAGDIPPPHSPFTAADRPPSAGARMIPPPPSLPLPLEPQLDYYSQRLRQLAGTTSPGVSTTANSGPLPLRKQTPPAFTSPGNSQPLPPSRSSTSPRNLSSSVNHNNNNNVSMSNNNLSEGSSDVDISMPSPSSKMATHDENDSLDLSSNVKADPSASADEKPTDFSVSHSTESEEKNRECEYCGKKFRFQSNLVVHRRTHTGEKPFKCSVCNHACTQSSKLKRHMKIHRKSNRGNGQTGGEGAEVAPVNGDGSTTSTPDDQMSNDGDEAGCSSDVEDQEHMVDDDDDEEAVDEEEEEEEEEDDEEEDEEEEEEDMELDDEGDEDDDGDVPEDLTTKSTSSTPSNVAAGAEEISKSLHSPRPTPSQTPLGKSVTPLLEGSAKIGNSSLVGELMDTFGLSNIHTYSEAYKQAKQVVMQDAMHNPHIRKKDEAAALDAAGINNNNGISKLDAVPPHLQNGLKVKSLASLKMKEEFAKTLAMAGQQPPLDIIGASHSFFGTGLPFENLLDVANKRMKLDLEGRHNPLLGRNGLPPDDGIYPGLWFPAMTSTPHPRDLFGRGDLPLDMFKPSRTSKSNLENRHDGAGAKSLAAAAAAAAAMNLNLPGHQPQPHMKKESRRNDTCEYCGKVFKNCSNLTVHRRSHTGEKPYKCELCSYACAQSSKLTRHMKTHGRMGKDVYKCRFCEMPFSVPSTLEKHMRKCVVNQNMKNDNGHMVVPSMLLKCDDDSSLSSAKDNT